MIAGRNRAIRQLEAWLLSRRLPRFHMLLIVLTAGVAGFLCSYALLRAGLVAMWARYPLAAGFGYFTFFLLLRLWLHCQATEKPVVTGDDVADAVLNNMPSADIHDGSSLSDAVTSLDADEPLYVILLLGALLAGLLVCVYIIWTAPTLLAELLLDGLILNRLYKGLQHERNVHWALTALRRTWFPALLLAACLSVAGFALQRLAPEAHSIGPVLVQLAHRHLGLP